MASALLDFIYSMGMCFSCFPSSPQLKINNRSFKILRLLGEGGFSYVYLVEDTASHQLFALKKIRCPFGQESVSLALKEVEAYSLFAGNDNIIHAVDHAVASDKSDPGAKTVYILLPYYRRGNLQDMINANLVNHTKFPEKRLMVLFLGVCRALKAMHQYKVRGGGDRNQNAARKVREQAARADRQAAQEVRRGEDSGDDDDEAAEPLMEAAGGEVMRSQDGVAPGQIRAYAHRDIKPGNIMIDDDGTNPILMDLGSLAASPTPITSRSQALAVQDQAAEHSTMPYRAPELFDVKTGSAIDTKVDIWSLGCTLYACLVGKSPFEARSDETGGSLSLCVLGGDWKFPDEGAQAPKRRVSGRPEQQSMNGSVSLASAGGEGGGGGVGGGGGEGAQEISAAVKDVVRRCLAVEPAERPDVDALIGIVEDVIAGLEE